MFSPGQKVRNWVTGQTEVAQKPTIGGDTLDPRVIEVHIVGSSGLRVIDYWYVGFCELVD